MCYQSRTWMHAHPYTWCHRIQICFIIHCIQYHMQYHISFENLNLCFAEKAPTKNLILQLTFSHTHSKMPLRLARVTDLNNAYELSSSGYFFRHLHLAKVRSPFGEPPVRFLSHSLPRDYDLLYRTTTNDHRQMTDGDVGYSCMLRCCFRGTLQQWHPLLMKSSRI